MADYETLIRHIESRTRRRSLFVTHAALYLFFALCAVIFLLQPDFWRFMTLPNTGDIALILILWSAAFIAHAARFFVRESGEKQIEQLYRQVQASGKTKRDHSRLVLQDDGETLDIIEEHPRLQRDDALGDS